MSLAKIAEVAGVSSATVSRVLNKRPGISVETTKKVLDIVKQMDYSPLPRANRPGPNVASKGIKNGNCGMVLMGVESTILHGPYARLVNQVGAALSDYGLNFLLGCVNSSQKTPAFLSNGQVDCVIFLGSVPSKEWFHKVVKDTPCLWVMGAGEPFGDHIYPDNELVGMAAAKYLVSKDCKKTVGLMYHSSNNKMWDCRRKGFVDYMESQQSRHVMLESNKPESEFDPVELTQYYIQKIKDMPEKPDGIFVTSDSEVPIVYREISKIGLRPSVDVHVVSVNNDESCLMSLDPRPATIDLCPEVIGQMAVEQILWRIAKPHFDSRISSKVEPILITPEEDTIRIEDI